jgi:hypothetical protein
MADAAPFLLAPHMHSMPLLAHLEELRKRIIFSLLGVLVGFLSCWSYADRIFGLMQQPIIRALRHHGLGGGLVYLNPTEPFNLYLEVGFAAGLFAASPFVFYQLWLFIAPGLYRNEKRYVSAVLTQYGRFVHGRRLFWLQDGLSGVARFLSRLRPTLSTHDYDRGIYETVFDSHRRSRADFRNAGSRILSGFDAGDYGSLDVAEPALFHTRDFYCRGNYHTDHRHLEHVSFRCSHDRALRH